jgi:predicted ATPase
MNCPDDATAWEAWLARWPEPFPTLPVLRQTGSCRIHPASPELRTATSLARMWREQGKRAECRDLLSSIYNWFTEGFETRDLKDAKALLDELG